MSQTEDGLPIWESIIEGQELPPLTIDMAFSKVVLSPAFTKDPYPGHYDVDYVRSLGHPTVFLNTMTLISIFDRLVTNWTGPWAFVAGHTLSMLRPTYADTTFVVTGTVTRRYSEPRPNRFGPDTLVEVETFLHVDGNEHCRGTVTVALA